MRSPFLSLALVLTTTLVACAPAAPASPTAAPKQAEATKPAASPAASPAAKPAGAPSPSPSPSPSPAASPAASGAAAKPAAAPELTPLQNRVSFKLRTPFVPSINYAPFYAAQELYWPRLGLDGEALPGTGSAAAVKTVAAGSEQMGFANIGAILAAINEGAPLTLLAVLHRRDVSGAIYFEDSGIKEPKDLIGKTVGAFTTGSNLPMLRAGLKKAGIDPEQVRWVTVTPGAGPTLLLERKIEVLNSNAGFQDTRLRCEGHKLTSFGVADLGLEVYGDAIFANTNWMQQVGDEVVVRALYGALQGSILAKSDVSAASAIMNKLQPNTPVDPSLELVVISERGGVRMAMEPDAPVVLQNGYGWIDEQELNRSAEALVSAELLDKKPDIKSVYTVKYLQHPAVKGVAMQWVNTPFQPLTPELKQRCGL